MEASNEADLLVVGGGILGAFHAYHALQRGLSVILLERHAAPQSATVRNFGQVIPSGMNLTWQRWGRESLQVYKAIQSQFDVSVRQQGSIYIASDDDELQLLEELATINKGNDYPSRLLTVKECCDRYPLLRKDYCRGGLFFPEEISVNPRVMIHRLHAYLAEQVGYQGRFRTCVREMNSRHGRLHAVTTEDESFYADRVVVCCGSEFQLLFPTLFKSSDIQLVKLQMLRLVPQATGQLPGNILTGRSIRRYESFAECPSWQEIKSRESQDTFCQRWGIHILFKQEADGGIILGDSHEYTSASRAEELSFDLRSDVNEAFLAEGRDIFDLPSWDVETCWSGVYGQTSDPAGIFTADVADNLHIATGIGGKGMSSSPGFARYHLGEIYND